MGFLIGSIGLADQQSTDCLLAFASARQRRKIGRLTHNIPSRLLDEEDKQYAEEFHGDNCDLFETKINVKERI